MNYKIFNEINLEEKDISIFIFLLFKNIIKQQIKHVFIILLYFFYKILNLTFNINIHNRLPRHYK